MTTTDWKRRVPLGRTGLQVSRMGLASGYGVPAAVIERAIREYGVNYLYISPLLNLGNMVRAIRDISPGHRDELFIVLARPFLGGFGTLRLERFVERWLKKLRLEWADLLFQDMRKPLSAKLTDRVQRLKDRGMVRHIGLSSHNRLWLGRIARGEIDDPIDFFHLRYNAVHRGAEQDIFPHLAAVPDERPGAVCFTATCWRKLLKVKNMPDGEQPLSAAQCYRFVLHQPRIDVCLTGPSTAEQLDENLSALEDGPLSEEELSRIKRIGDRVYGKKRRKE